MFKVLVYYVSQRGTTFKVYTQWIFETGTPCQAGIVPDEHGLSLTNRDRRFQTGIVPVKHGRKVNLARDDFL